MLAEQEGDFDADSRWALEWFDQFGFAAGDYGDAETLSKAKKHQRGRDGGGRYTEFAGRAGTSYCGRGNCRSYWDPEVDSRLTAWEMVHHLVRVCWSSAASWRRRCWSASWAAGREVARDVVLQALCPVRTQVSALPRPWPTTGWCRAGPRSVALPGHGRHAGTERTVRQILTRETHECGPSR